MNYDKYNKFEDEGYHFIYTDLANHNIRLKTPESQKEKKIGSVVAKSDFKPTHRNYINSSSKEEISSSYFRKLNDKLNFIGKYFDVEQGDIKDKLICSVNPFNTNFQKLAEKAPDLYGPFWIYSTLVFIVAVAGNISNYISHFDKSLFRYDFSFVPVSAGYIYGVGLLLPIVLSLLMKIFHSEISLILIICYYGYSFTIFIPTLILCVIPYEIVKWILLGYAIASSTLFLIFNLWKELSKYEDKSRYIILGIIIITQLILLFLLKYYFFSTYIIK